MKELDDFTVERLKEIEARARVSIALLKGDEVAALARIALTAKTAEPVAFRVGERLFCSLYAAGGYASEMRLTIEPMYLDAQPNSPELPDGWIPCNERMPECGQWDHAAVIVSEGNNSFIAYYNKRDGKFLDEPFGMSVGNKVTHWQPLPAPPTTEK